MRHKWDKQNEKLKNKFTEQHQCIKCGVYRIKVMGSWVYSKDMTSNNNPFVKTTKNQLCIAEQYYH